MASQGDLGINSIISDFDELTYYNSTQIVLWGLTCFYMAGCLVIIIWPLWGLMNATTSSSVMGPVFMFKGLFVQCAQYMGGQYQCDNYLSPVFDQTWNLILVRTMGVLSMIFACVSTGLLLMGLDCIRMFEENPTRKLIIMRFGVFMLLTSGILLSCISIFYAHFIKREFHWYEAIPDNVVNTDFIKFEYGGCVYAAFILSLLNYILVFFLFKTTIVDDVEEEEESQDSGSTGISDSIISATEDQKLLKYAQGAGQNFYDEPNRQTKLSNSIPSRKSNRTTTTGSTADAVAVEYNDDGFI